MSRIVNALFKLLFVVGLLMVAAPLATRISTDFRNARSVSRVSSEAACLDEGQCAALLAQAHAYNDLLAGVDPATDEAAGRLRQSEVLPYEEQLGGASQAVGWVEIPEAAIELPLYLGTGVDALAAGVGHLEGSSLPVGGASTHCVLTGHSGMATSRMFDGIRQLGAGDLMAVHALGQDLTYEVFGSEVVLPDEVSTLRVRPGEDLLTLVTCTPYGVNDHRLLVYARRTDRVIEASVRAADEGRLGVVRPSLLGSVGACCGSLLCGATILQRRRAARGR